MKVIFDGSGWLIAAVICALAFGLLVFTGECIIHDDSGGHYRLNRPSFYIGWSITLVMLYTIANGIVAFTSFTSQNSPTATIGDVTKSFGLKSGRAYPLELGERFSGTTGEVTGDLFYTHGSFSPSTSLSIGFEHAGSSYILEFPTNAVTFKQTENTQPTVQLYLDSSAPSEETSFQTRFGACQWTYHDLWFVCEKKLLSNTLKVPAAVKQTGLSPIVSAHFQSATITLTPQMYQSLLKGQ